MKLYLGRFLKVVPGDQMDLASRNGHLPIPLDDGVADRALLDLKKYLREISLVALSATTALSKFMPKG